MRRLKDIKDEKAHLQKNLEFFAKVEEEIKEKEVKLAENIKNAEEEMTLSKKRAEKYFSIYTERLQRARPTP